MKKIAMVLLAGMLFLPFFASIHIQKANAITSITSTTGGDFNFADNGNGRATITGYTGTATDITIPATVTTYVTMGELSGMPISLAVTGIAGYAFSEDGLTNVTIPPSVTIIGAQAFAHNKLTNVTIPSSVTSIGDYAFGDNQITKATVPSSVTSIGISPFVQNPIQAITVDSNNINYKDINGTGLYTKDGKHLIQGTISGEIASGTLGIMINAFTDLGLKSVTIPSSVTSITDAAFAGNQLTSVTILNKDITDIASSAFSHNQDSPADLTIYGFGTNIKNYADTNGFTFQSAAPSLSVDPLSGSAYSHVSGHNQIHVSGKVDDSHSTGFPFTVKYQVLDQNNNLTAVSGSKNGTGTFSFSFDVTDSSLSEGNYNLKVSVVDDNNDALPKKTIPFTVDTAPPVITLNGSPTVTLNVGDSYSDKGATATGTTNPVKMTGTVDTSKTGTYTLHYNVTDDAGNPAAEVTRTVVVSQSKNANLNGLTVSEGTLGPKFASGTTAYTVNVDNGVNSIKVRPTVADKNATVTVNGSTITSGSESAPIDLKVGKNTISVEVTAQDGTTVKDYEITVNRAVSGNANLSGLTLSTGKLNPGFSALTTGYQVNVGNDIRSLTVTPTVADGTAIVAVNRTAVVSGMESAPVLLNVGKNTISVEVTAPDGSVKNYEITVTRAPSSNANLSGLKLSAGTLDSAFDAANMIYTANVDNNVDSLTVTPTVSNETATVRVNGTAMISGSASNPIELKVGKNAITIEITAPNGSVKDYEITVNRAPSSNANLSGLKLSAGTLDSAFDAAKMSYTASVDNNVDSLTVTPTVSDETATVTVNGKTVKSGDASAPIDLNVGKNTVTVKVTAQDGTTKTYDIEVTRLEILVNSNVYAHQHQNGGLVTISGGGIPHLANKGKLHVDLTSNSDKITWIKFTKEQMIGLKNRQASIDIAKKDVKLTIPVDIFTENPLTIVVKRLDSKQDHVSKGNLAVSSVYNVTLQQGDHVIHQLNGEAVIAFPVGDNVDHPEQLKVYYWNESTKQWEKVGGVYKDGMIQTVTHHFSTYAVFSSKDLASVNSSDHKEKNDSGTSVKDEVLPNTATEFYNWLLVGGILAIMGATLFFISRFRRKAQRNE